MARAWKHPDVLWVVVARDGGPIIKASWSRGVAVDHKNKLAGDFVVRKYRAAPPISEVQR